MATLTPQQNGHSIQNARVSTSDERFSEQTEERLARVQFLKGRVKKKNRFASNDPSFYQTNIPQEGPEYGTEENSLGVSRINAVSPQNRARKRLLKKSTLSTSLKWSIIGIASTCYLFQFLFGLMSLASYYGSNMIDSSLWTSWVNVFIDISGGLQEAGSLLWGISALIAFATFLGFFLWYKILSINPFHSEISIFITILLLSVSLLPVMNLFPWLVLWILYINVSSVFSKD
jgi:hypothetical protein